MPANTYDSAIALIYRAALEPDLWAQTLESIAACTGDNSAILLYGRDDGGFGVIPSPSLTGMVAEYLRDGWNFRDSRAIRSRERGYFIGRDVITDRDVLSVEETRSDPFYTEFLCKFGFQYFAAAMVSPNKRVEVAMSIQRRIGRPEFTEEEMDDIARLGNHVEQSLRLGMQLMDAHLINEGLAIALARVGIGVFVLDVLGRVVFSNPMAQSLVGDGIDVSDERLSLDDAESHQKLMRLIAGLAEGDHGAVAVRPKPILVPRLRSERPLAVYSFPITGSSKSDAFLARATTIVLLVDSASGEPADPTMIRDLMGLTLSEARLASLVGIGLPPKQAAERLGISEQTARSVLKRVFSKVGVSRQSELVSLMTRLLLR